MKHKALRHEFRKERTRKKLSINTERPRLSVRRSNKHLYAQVIDDNKGTTLAFASSLSKEAKGSKSVASATKLGALIAKKAIEKGVKQVRFDRGGRIYHGRVKAVAEAARAAGLEF